MTSLTLLIFLTAATQNPSLLQTSDPVYPPSALADRIAASVTLQLEVNAKGHVQTAQVIETDLQPEDTTHTLDPSVDYGFAKAAQTAAKGLLFSPMIVDGTAVSFVITYSYAFELPKPAPPVSESVPNRAGNPPDPVINLHGVVRAGGRRTRLAHGIVTATQGDEAYEATTDQDGRFAFYDLAPGPWEIRLDFAGYELGKSTETIVSGKATEATYYLKPSTASGYDVVIKAAPVKREVTRRALAAEQILQVPGTLGDPVLVVENLPGVARTGFGGSAVIRGSAPKDSRVMLESVPILIDTHLGGFRSVVAPQLVERIDFMPGNFSARYGRLIGGVLDVRMRRLAPDQMHGELDLSMLDAGLYLETPITDELAVAVAGRRSHVDYFLKEALQGDDLQVTAAPRYYDYQALVSWRPTASQDFELFLLGSDDRMSLVFGDAGSIDAQATGQDLNSVTAFQRLSARHRYRPSDRIKNEAVVSWGRDDLSSQAFGRFNFNAVLDHVMLRDQLEIRASDRATIIGGIDLQHQTVDFNITAPRPQKEGQLGQETEILTAEGTLTLLHAGAYLEAELEWFDGLTLIPGIRTDYFSRIGRFGFDPRLTVRYQPLSALTLKAGVGLMHQAPELDEMESTYGNPDLGLISAAHYAVGTEIAPTDFLFADVTLFYKDMNRLVRPTDRVEVNNGVARPLVYDNGGQGRVYGLEVMLRQERRYGLEGWISYTLSRAERTDAGPAPTNRLFDYDQTHIFAAVGTYHLGASWSVGARWRYVSGRPTTPILGGIWRAEQDNFEPIPGAVNSGRLPAFHQLDVRIDKRWTFDTWAFSAYLSVSNAYNQANVEALGYNFDYRQTESINGLPILPILGLKGQF